MEFHSTFWAIPFLGIIFSMSFLPLLCSKLWEKYAFCVPFFWTSIYIVAIGIILGISHIIPAILEPIFFDYIPFIVLIISLYVTSGGIFIDFPKSSGSIFNVSFLFFGSIIAGWIGTTGAAILLIRPFLRANAYRKNKTHLMIFFIFLVANIGGGATPLGDPPLFMGFLNGIDFFWFLKHLWPYLISSITILCVVFFVVDSILLKKEKTEKVIDNTAPKFIFEGSINVFLILGILLSVILCDFSGTFSFFGETFNYSSVLRNIILFSISLISMKLTPAEIRKKNCFDLSPVYEIAGLFFGIFITVTPIIYILHQGVNGEFKGLFDWIAPNNNFIPNRCFWASGLLSSILDNAPTFLIFFHLTSGDANILMTTKAHILKSFSLATVFMGALTYIGNAPNLMVKSISADYDIAVPSFLKYIVWSFLILIPLFIVLSFFL